MNDEIIERIANEVPDIVTPCHGVSFYVTTRIEGSAYMQSEVPDEVWCSAPDCLNSWDATGKSDVWNRMPVPAVNETETP